LCDVRGVAVTDGFKLEVFKNISPLTNIASFSRGNAPRGHPRVNSCDKLCAPHICATADPYTVLSSKSGTENLCRRWEIGLMMKWILYVAATVCSCRHVVKLEKEAVDLGLVATTTTKQDEPGSSEQHD